MTVLGTTLDADHRRIKASSEYFSVAYRDDGCEVAPKCTECPLPSCVFDFPRFYTKIRKDIADLRIAETYYAQITAAELAIENQVTERTIWRTLERVRLRFPLHLEGFQREGHDVVECGCGEVLRIGALLIGEE